MPYKYKGQGGFNFFFHYATNTWVSSDCCIFLCLSWSYNNQMTPVCLLHSEKSGKKVLPYVFNMVLPTSPFSDNLTLSLNLQPIFFL